MEKKKQQYLQVEVCRRRGVPSIWMLMFQQRKRVSSRVTIDVIIMTVHVERAKVAGKYMWKVVALVCFSRQTFWREEDELNVILVLFLCFFSPSFLYSSRAAAAWITITSSSIKAARLSARFLSRQLISYKMSHLASFLNLKTVRIHMLVSQE